MRLQQQKRRKENVFRTCKTVCACRLYRHGAYCKSRNLQGSKAITYVHANKPTFLVCLSVCVCVVIPTIVDAILHLSVYDGRISRGPSPRRNFNTGIFSFGPEMACGRVSFCDTTGYGAKTRIKIWIKVVSTVYIHPALFPGLLSVDRSCRLISR